MPIRFAIMRKLFNSLLCAFCAALLVACSDEASDYPPVVTDLLLVKSDAQGRCSEVVLDNGAAYDVSWQNVGMDVRDSLMRCKGVYVIEQGKMTLYGLEAVFADKPYPTDAFQVGGEPFLPRDPVKLVSMWRSGGYVNMQLGVMTSGQKGHLYAFCEDSAGVYSLLHLRPSADAEAYTQTVYLSMPVPQAVETVTFSINTYDGVVTRTFN